MSAATLDPTRGRSLPFDLASPGDEEPGRARRQGNDLALAAAAAAAVARAREDVMSLRSSASKGTRAMADRASTQILPIATSSPLPPVPPGGGSRCLAVHSSEKPLDALRKARRSSGSLRAGRGGGHFGRSCFKKGDERHVYRWLFLPRTAVMICPMAGGGVWKPSPTLCCQLGTTPVGEVAVFPHSYSRRRCPHGVVSLDIFYSHAVGPHCLEMSHQSQARHNVTVSLNLGGRQQRGLCRNVYV